MESDMIGTVVSHFRILSKLGEGGMGVVYKAEDLRLGRPVALKFIPPGIYANEGVKDRFLREAQSTSALSHPAICTIFAIEEADGRPFIVMECVEGETLRSRLARGTAQLSDVVSWGIQIADGLAAAHDREIIHRDIKPENLMVRGDGRVQILDFGLARWRGTSPLSVSGSTMGTLAYMSPEQAQGLVVDARADIYSLGAVLYELLAGRPPFTGAHDAALLYEIVNKDVQPLAEVNPAIPPSMTAIIMKCLSRNRESRFTTARELSTSLRDEVREMPPARKSGKSGAGEAHLPVSGSNLGIRRPRLLLFAVGLLLAGIGVWAAKDILIPAPASLESIAILPLINASPDTSLEYLSDGLTESIINNLSRLSTVKVMSRSSVFHYKGREVDPQAVGRELGVRGVLVGRVISRDGYVTVSAELLRTSDNTHIWGDQFRRKGSELFALQQDVAGEIARNLTSRITPEERSRMSATKMESAEAYELYLKGRYHWNKRTPEDLRESVRLFRAATENDPGFAEASAGLGDAYNVMMAWGFIDPETGIREGEANARKALELDSRLAAAHAALGGTLSIRYEREGALVEYRRAIELDPNNAAAFQWCAEDLAGLRRFDEAIEMIQHALDLDPLSQIISASAAGIYGDYHLADRAIELARKTVEIDPRAPMGHFALGMAWTRTGRYPEAIEELEKCVVIADSETPMLSWLGVANALDGKKEVARRIILRLETRSREKYVSPYMKALVYTALGDKGRALDLLEEGTRVHDGWMQEVYEETVFDSLRSDRRYDNIVRGLGFVH